MLGYITTAEQAHRDFHRIYSMNTKAKLLLKSGELIYRFDVDCLSIDVTGADRNPVYAWMTT
jgi:hypothetical protein